jgi:alanyl-tRNA synthetase
MTTARLYFDDAYLREFSARVVSVSSWKGTPAVVLDRTAFYPEAGGQLGDRGVIGGVAVGDVQVDEDGTIFHLVEGGTLEVGAEVRGTLDWGRRRLHMAQHTAQHLLSAALLERAGAATASARLGESSLTIDLARDRIPEGELAAAEELANSIVDDALPVRAWFPSAEELAGLKLRRDPKVEANIRVVAIGEFDRSPCGGTHCASSAELGAVRILGVERYKGMTRVTFAAGRRTREELFGRDQALRAAATALGCGVAEVPAAVERMRAAGDAQAAEVTALRGRLATALIAGMGETGRVVAELPVEAELLRTIAARLAASGRDAVLSAPDGDGLHVVLFRANGSSLDCAALWKKLMAVGGGRGGGKAERAEGRLAARVEVGAAIGE